LFYFVFVYCCLRAECDDAMRKRLKVSEERLLEVTGSLPTTHLHLECRSFAVLFLCNVLDVYFLN